MALPSKLTRRPAALAAAFGLAVGLSVAAADEPPAAANGDAKTEATAAPAATVPAYTLSACVETAYQRQPALHALRASLANAELGLAALCKPGLVASLAPDIEVRRQQAALGVTAARAELMQAEFDAVYSVTRLYLTVLYARSQRKFLEETVTVIRDNVDLVKSAVERPDFAAGLVPALVDRYVLARQRAEVNVLEADFGEQRALAALREAIGLSPCEAFTIPGDKLPDFRLTVPRCEVVQAALARRGELTMTRSGAEVVRFEADAQDSARLRPVFRTFASGADIHARQVPLPDYGANYRPGGVAIEMPPNLAGSRPVRVERAEALGERAAAAAEKVSNLIALEADVTWLTYSEAERKLPLLKGAVKSAAEIDKKLRDLQTENKAYYRDNLQLIQDRAQAEAAYARGLLEYLVSLAALERATAGGLKVGFPDRLTAPAPASNGDTGDGDKKADGPKTE